MAQIKVEELESRAVEIVREVRERHATYVVTDQGVPVGLLSPLDEESEITSRSAPYGSLDAWDQLVKIGDQVTRRWVSPKSSPDLISEMRR